MSNGGKINLPVQNDHLVGCFQNKVLPLAGVSLPELIYAFMATSAPDHLYFGWHVVQKTDSEITAKNKVKDKVDTNNGAAGSSSNVDSTSKQGNATGRKKRRMDRWDERPSNTDGGNGAIGEAQKLSGARSGCQVDYDWAFARALFVIMIGRWWWFLSAAAWHALLRAAPLGVDAVDVITEFECHSSRYGACLLSHESWCMVGGFCLFSSESWCMDENLTPWSLPPGYDVDAQCFCCPTSQVKLRRLG